MHAVHVMSAQRSQIPVAQVDRLARDAPLRGSAASAAAVSDSAAYKLIGRIATSYPVKVVNIRPFLL